MKWCQVNGQTFDRSQVIRFRLDGNRVMAVFGVYDFGLYEGEFYQVCVGTLDENLNIEAFNDAMDALIGDIIAGNYDLPGQSQFIALTDGCGYETSYLNVDHIVHANDSMAGLELTMSNGKVFNLSEMHGDSVHDDAPQFIKDDAGRVYRAFGGKDYGWESKQRQVKQEAVKEQEAVLTLSPTLLSWNGEKVYEQACDNDVGAFWLVNEGKAYRLMWQGKQITSECYEGLRDMASEQEEKPFDGKVVIKD